MGRRHNKFNIAYLGSAAFCLAIIGPVVWMWPHLSPFGFFEFWSLKVPLWDAVLGAWPAYLFGIALNLRHLLPTNGYKDSPGEILAVGFGISLWAGVMEEVCFRWLIFLGLIVLMPVADWILGGFVGLHLVQWIYEILSKIANYFTLGYLHQYLLNGYGWAVAAALMSANGRFRNGHGYQGIVGFTVSWFMGMYFFHVMFTYGLIAGIVIHFLYDFFIFSAISIDAMQEKWRMRRRIDMRHKHVREALSKFSSR